MESKQKFISQKMTNEIPVCFAKDVDEVVLSFAEVKCLPQAMSILRENVFGYTHIQIPSAEAELSVRALRP